ncbi:MAG TPA: hypothetical protein VKZ98_08370 [Aquaticitalea sp.]|nr:hypothetical protein [Aquaticitalea sp.]
MAIKTDRHSLSIFEFYEQDTVSSMKVFPLLFSLIFLFGCNSNEREDVRTTSQEKEADRVTAKDIANLEYTEYVLSPESKKAVLNWQRYQELVTNIEFLKQADFSFFGGKNELMLNFLKDLKKDVPPTLVTPAIKERLIALETKILKFHSTLKLSNLKKADILKDIKEILVATSNLHLQINKKFELEAQIIEDPSTE